MAWLSLKNKLSGADIDDIHECALVLSVAEELRVHVQGERVRFGSDAVVQRQLDPHITLLYGGFQSPATVCELEALAARFNARELDFSLTDVATFSNRSGFVTNVHYPVESEDLHRLHREVLAGVLEMGLRLQTPYVGDQYRPHLSIFDRVVLPKNIVTMMPAPPGRGHFRAGGCHLVGEPK